MGDEGKNLPVFLTTVEVAGMLKMSPRGLEKMRLEKRGPKYFRLGTGGRAKVLYALSDVLAWVETHRR